MYVIKIYLDENPSCGCGTCSDVDVTFGTSIMCRNVEILGKNIRFCMDN